MRDGSYEQESTSISLVPFSFWMRAEIWDYNQYVLSHLSHPCFSDSNFVLLYQLKLKLGPWRAVLSPG